MRNAMAWVEEQYRAHEEDALINKAAQLEAALAATRIKQARELKAQEVALAAAREAQVKSLAAQESVRLQASKEAVRPEALPPPQPLQWG